MWNSLLETIPYSAFKARSKNAKLVIRTGDFTAYTNVLLVSGGGIGGSQRRRNECAEVLASNWRKGGDSPSRESRLKQGT